LKEDGTMATLYKGSPVLMAKQVGIAFTFCSPVVMASRYSCWLCIS